MTTTQESRNYSPAEPARPARKPDAPAPGRKPGRVS